MSHVYRYRHVVRVLIVFASTLLGLAVAAPAAFAMRIGDEGSAERRPRFILVRIPPTPCPTRSSRAECPGGRSLQLSPSRLSLPPRLP